MSSRSGPRQGYSASPLLFNVIVEILDREIKEDKEINEIKFR